MNPFQTLADQLYNKLIELEGSADADQLFLCSYLLGHLSLVSAETGQKETELLTRMQQSLEDAFQVDQLSELDKQQITSLWQQIQS